MNQRKNIEYHHKKTSSISEDCLPTYFKSQKIKLKNNRKNKKWNLLKKMFSRKKANFLDATKQQTKFPSSGVMPTPNPNFARVWNATIVPLLSSPQLNTKILHSSLLFPNSIRP
jgi:hypothetical protein